MEIINVKTTDLQEYVNNPRDNDAAVDAVAESIKQFGFKVPIIVDRDGVIVAGHTRKKAAERLGLADVPCIVADDLTPEQIKAFRLADNKTGELAEWDFAALEKELAELTAFDVDMSAFGFDEGIFDEMESENYLDKFKSENYKSGSLSDRYIVPPLSILDTRQGYWQDRKKMWLEKTGNLNETRDGEFGRFGDSEMMTELKGGTSNFDPVLAEIVYKWFCVDGGKIIDPFGGEQTKGVVAGELGFHYYGCEIRADQVALNIEKTKEYADVHYFCGDSNDIDKVIDGDDFDLCFTSPPYYDLEVYSDDDMSSLGTYEEFMKQYKNIFKKCYDKLKDDSFLVVKVGEIRDKKSGIYRNFVGDNIRIMNEIGLKYYNEIILLNTFGNAPLRANRLMNTRKVVKVHQNVLVFYKGDQRNIKNKYKELYFEDEQTF